MKIEIVLTALLIWATIVNGENESVKDGKFFFFGEVSTLSHTIVSFTTSTIYASCYQGLSVNGPANAMTPTVCPGKRRKKRTVREMVRLGDSLAR